MAVSQQYSCSKTTQRDGCKPIEALAVSPSAQRRSCYRGRHPKEVFIRAGAKLQGSIEQHGRKTIRAIAVRPQSESLIELRA